MLPALPAWAWIGIAGIAAAFIGAIRRKLAPQVLQVEALPEPDPGEPSMTPPAAGVPIGSRQWHPRFSARSIRILETLDSRLQDLLNEVVGIVDITVNSGHRGEEEQERLFGEGKTKAHFGKSAHNLWPSQAADVSPIGLKGSKNAQYDQLMDEVVARVAQRQGINIVFGKDFKSFRDNPHIELRDWRKAKR